VIYGLIAAVMWGTATVAATIAARRAGTFITVLVGQGLGLIVLLVLSASLHPSLAAVHGAAAWGLIGAGLFGLFGYLSFYRALEDGPVGLVSAIGATYGGVTAVLAVALLGERLGGPGAAGAILAVGGVALAAARPQASAGSAPMAAGEPIVGVAPAPSDTRALSRAGIPLALVSALMYGVGGFLLGDFSGRVGWLSASLVARLASMAVLLVVLPFLGRPAAWRGTGSGVAWAAAAGLTDVVGVLAFARGGQVGQVAVTAAVSSVYPVIPLIAGLVLFDEHLGRRQALGVGLIIVGLVLLGLVT
jgi:drug/metabolite transporter (DMT)-like permease